MFGTIAASKRIADLDSIEQTQQELLRMAGQAASSGECAAAAEIFECGIEHFARSFALAGEYATFLHSAQDKTFRDIPRSVELARRAVKQSSRRVSSLLTLAAALGAAGDYSEATAVAEEVIKKSPPQYYRKKALDLKSRLVQERNTRD